MASNKLTRIAVAARAFRAEWEALPEEVRAVATDSVNDALAALRVLKELPPSVSEAASGVAKQAFAVWVVPFKSKASRLAKIRTCVEELPADLGAFLGAVLDTAAAEKDEAAP